MWRTQNLLRVMGTNVYGEMEAAAAAKKMK